MSGQFFISIDVERHRVARDDCCKQSDGQSMLGTCAGVARMPENRARLRLAAGLANMGFLFGADPDGQIAALPDT